MRRKIVDFTGGLVTNANSDRLITSFSKNLLSNLLFRRMLTNTFYFKAIICIIIAVLSSSLDLKAQSPCLENTAYITQDNTTSQANGSISLILNSPVKGITVSLYDIFEGGNEFTVVRQIKNPPVGRAFVVFEQLKSSAYNIQVEAEGCAKVVLGGIEGITVK